MFPYLRLSVYIKYKQVERLQEMGKRQDRGVEGKRKSEGPTCEPHIHLFPVADVFSTHHERTGTKRGSNRPAARSAQHSSLCSPGPGHKPSDLAVPLLLPFALTSRSAEALPERSAALCQQLQRGLRSRVARPVSLLPNGTGGSA